ncbi:hypothetical protein [Paraliomyxa miuraensis]|uniref:hypothetical protein n=1 Tax=Paraliomyxa miuraensis TaxID=376150 RepID=UPI002252B474|nr:hypothetical protein [Paraliomyxa miuraensis]MCX4247445.1 hypothetical protein [Paraliomyxa miuraensis]
MITSTIFPFLATLGSALGATPAAALMAPASTEAADVASETESEPSAAEPGSEPATDAASAPAPAPAPTPAGDEEPAASSNPFGDVTGAEPAPAPAPTSPPLSAAPTPPPAAPIPPPPPRPIRWRLDFGVGLGVSMIQDLGYRAFAERRNLPEYGTSVMFDFRLAEGRIFLGGGLAYARSQRTGDAYGSQLLHSLEFHEPRVLGRLSFMAIDGLDAFARVGVGPSIGQLSMTSQQYAEQDVVIPRVDGQAGLSVYLPKKWLARKQASRVSAGLDLALGYTWRGKIDVQPTLSQGDEPLRATTSPLGALSLHGFSWGLGLFLRVM